MKLQSTALRSFCLGMLLASALYSQSREAPGAPTITIEVVPPFDPGGPDKIDAIAGTVTSAPGGCKVVIFARGDVWYVQPWANAPFTEIDRQGNWRRDIHLGTEYAALLVRGSWEPPTRASTLPVVQGDVLAIATAAGKRARAGRAGEAAGDVRGTSEVQFAGYVWGVKSADASVGPGPNYFSEHNVSVDSQGRLHLRISREGERWKCAEVINKKSLGYGTYTFAVEETSHLPPDVVLGLFTWDTSAKEYHNREIDVEISRWGNPSNKNGQFVIQPYTQPENMVRFDVPAGAAVHAIEWTPGRVRCTSVRAQFGSAETAGLIHEHTFTAGIPPAGGEQPRINLWLVGGKPSATRADTEVVISSFEFRPWSGH